MNILLLGSGGREDALAWRLRQSPSCETLLAAPGNPGIARWADCVAIDPTDREAVVALARAHEIGLVVVGPEAPLVAGVADACRTAGIPVFGPSAAAAALEGSKGFTKDLCRREAIPTADYVRVEGVDEALHALHRFSLPVVIKADGLAAGKGVTVAATRAEAEQAVREAEGGPLVIEEFLDGEEASLFALCDGETVVALASAQDHKRVGEGDTGPNTGGMGAYSPAPVLSPELEVRAMQEIVEPTVRAMAAAGTPFSGVLYAGLMLTAGGPKLIEYNVRFGDPECEAIMPRLEGDVAELLLAVATGRLADAQPVTLSDEVTMTVVMAADGYPGTPRRGSPIDGIDTAEQVPGVTVFHAGTARHGSGALLSAGGRVLAVTARADTLANAKARAYRAIDQIDFPDGFCRRDIGWRELARAEA
ncbi:phosphoribosylamine--glycine ligase [Sphingomonas ginkgonis]|uniref:Phosphoribosylamine--glycine ligase n=1 Tax=Sphingomonas ginkgonis TaxID=2315330 RepID=A0A429V7P6_9SPHN|nr:phosphoribosylamine--glycine ligase [Sphingomonas ginkgonis]RST29897.1 phosphoribosylamine--glycine ligase [Sphingomonas ginkgonis]